MKAYAILDGGGVKGAALVGALYAADQQGIQFEGYGGTSAGAIVATLAAVGFPPGELREIVLNELRFDQFVADCTDDIYCLRAFADEVGVRQFWKHRHVLKRVYKQLGLARGDAIGAFLKKMIAKRHSQFKHAPDITFNDLLNCGCKPLKIVASDLGTRLPQIYSAYPPDQNGSVIDAVRASASYPFVFQPVKVNERYLVDGGLCTNLPVFLFEPERALNRLPLIAFDLVSSPPAIGGDYSFGQFCCDMLDAALESGDYLLRNMISGVHHIRIQVPSDIRTLDFDLSSKDAERLFEVGQVHAYEYFAKAVPQWMQVTNEVEALQAKSASRPTVVEFALKSMVASFEALGGADALRASIMLPTDRRTRIVVYHYGMDTDPDIDLELALESGISGRTWHDRVPIAADLDAAKGNFEKEWGMTRQQQNKVRADRKAMISFPLFDTGVKEPSSAPLLGTLSVDTSTHLADTGWVGGKATAVAELGMQWAAIVSRLLA